MTNNHQIKSAKRAVDSKGEDIIDLFLDHRCRAPFWKDRLPFAFQILTAQFVADPNDFKQQKIFKKIRGRMGRKKMEERQQMQNKQREYEAQILQALGAAAEAKIIINHIARKIEPDGYDVQSLITEALELAEAEAKEQEEMEQRNGNT